MKIEAENFWFLVEQRWKVINAPNIRKLKEKKPNVVEMPLTADITKFLNYLNDEIAKLVKELKSQDNILDPWKRLSKVCLVYLIILIEEGKVRYPN